MLKRGLVLVAALLPLGGGCDDVAGQGMSLVTLPDAPVAAVAPAAERAPSLAERYYLAYLAETVSGDRPVAIAGYKEILGLQAGTDLGAADRAVLPRAALRLAELYAHEGRRQEALDLLGQVEVLGREDPELRDAADGLRVRLASGGGNDTAVRGPPAYTPVEGVSANASALLRTADKLMLAYLSKRVQHELEKYQVDLPRKQLALLSAERAYERVVELDEPVATAAAEFRIASLHHDGALFMLALRAPTELNEKFRREQIAENRNVAVSYLRQARTEYTASLVAAPGVPGAELWHAAARAGASGLPRLRRD